MGAYMKLGIAVFLLSSLVVTSAALGSHPVDKPIIESLIPKDAESIRSVKESTWNQMSFVVNRTYPAYAFDDTEINRWIKTSWVKCSTSSDWMNYTDRSTAMAVEVHQRTTYLAKDDVLLILSGRYRSKTVGVSTPDSSVQYGLIRWSKLNKKEKKALCPEADRRLGKKS
jgi:hypothetical protein